MQYDMQQARNIASSLFMAVLFVTILAMPEAALAQTTAEGRVTGFLAKLNSILNVASVAIVTIAVIFAGYQIAFAHKRISDVAPVLIGGFLIGAAAQLAKMVIPEDVASPVGAILSAMPSYA